MSRITVSIPFSAKRIAKFLVAIAGLAGSALSLGLVPAAEKPWVTLAVGLVTSAGVYLVPNSTQKSSGN